MPKRLVELCGKQEFNVIMTFPQVRSEIKQQLTAFLRDKLKLELSKAKTLIAHARTQAAKFLGYEVTTIQDNAKRSRYKGVMRRSVNGQIGLRVPREVLQEKCSRYRRKGKAVHRTELTNESDYTILTTYQLEFRGFAAKRNNHQEERGSRTAAEEGFREGMRPP